MYPDDPEKEMEPVTEVTVDLEKPIEPEKEPAKPEPTPKPDQEVVKLRNTIAYQTRKLEQAMREMTEVKNKLNEKPKVQTQEPEDEIDREAQLDWKRGVKMLVEKEFNIEEKVNEIIAKRDQARHELERKSMLDSELEKSKTLVLSKYPTIEDEATSEATFYRQVLNEDPSLLSNVHGPEIAMYRMEEKLRTSGITPSNVKPIVDKEVNRLVRAGASNVVGRQGSPNGKVSLTKEQETFCDRYNIPYDQYKRNLKSQETGFGGGVEA